MQTLNDELPYYADVYRKAVGSIQRLLDSTEFTAFDLFSYKFLLDIRSALENSNQFMFYSEEPYLLLNEAIKRKEKALGWK